MIVIFDYLSSFISVSTTLNSYSHFKMIDTYVSQRSSLIILWQSKPTSKQKRVIMIWFQPFFVFAESNQFQHIFLFSISMFLCLVVQVQVFRFHKQLCRQSIDVTIKNVYKVQSFILSSSGIFFNSENRFLIVRVKRIECEKTEKKRQHNTYGNKIINYFLHAQMLPLNSADK